jgi:hypothetical protein
LRKLLLLVAALAIAGFSFVLGGLRGESIAKLNVETAQHYLDENNNIPLYNTASEISRRIAEEKYDHAKCIADVTASFYYREIQSCLSNNSCRGKISENVQRSAPELLTGDKSKFVYYENAERCVFSDKGR